MYRGSESLYEVHGARGRHIATIIRYLISGPCPSHQDFPQFSSSNKIPVVQLNSRPIGQVPMPV